MSPLLTGWQYAATQGGIIVDEKVSALGVTPEYLLISNRKILMGRNISMLHVEYKSPVCLIGSEISSRLFPHTNPLDKIMTVSTGRKIGFPCKIIGVMAPQSSTEEWIKPNLNIILPYTYFQTVTDNWWSSTIHEAQFQVSPGTDMEKSGKKIKTFFEQKYGKSGRFYVDSNSTLIAQMKKFLNIFSLMLTGIALLSLMVGGIGINNMMLVSVTDRLKEFGIRKALGATNRSIRAQVLLESMALCLVAGILGIIIGIVMYHLLIFAASKFIHHLKFEWIFEPIAILFAFFSILAVGIGSGLVPARRAQKLQIIEALRAE